MQGQRASNKEKPVNPNQPAPKTISSSQQSYDQMIQPFNGMISVLESEPTYTPNETELKVTALQTKLQELKDTNDQVANAYTAVSNARIERNKTLYKDDSRLVDTACEVKIRQVRLWSHKS